MRAAVLDVPGQPLRIYDDVEIEEPHAGEARVRVHQCGVCHSDLSIVDGSFPGLTPAVLGHEAAGVVEAVGAGVTSLVPGDRVVLTPCPPCGRCYFCQRGQFSICVNSAALATSAMPDGGTRLSRDGSVVYRGLAVGAFGEYAMTHEAGAVKIGDDVPLDVACVLGCAVQTGVGAVINTAGVEPGATVLVIGLGGVGMSVVQGARLAGAARIIVSDPVAERRDAATAFGATDLLDPTVDDLVTAAFDLTDGIGVDYAFDAAGKSALVAAGIHATRPGGTTVMVGVPPLDDPVVIEMPAIFASTEKRLVGCLLGSVHSNRDIPRMISLWQAGRLDLEGLITGRRPLAEINEAFDDLRASRGIRTVLDV